ncbi:MAG: hypothetical protein A3F74_26535 [Betaproteobacteria bacterium RIFCSPLOWO2_12_FULL_62_58]|nr:MAG: hypothetical protein A3F74_26535 [Betaproteobacteria bacterium RIFCSPLOWO2_12_FULL_62_58]
MWEQTVATVELTKGNFEEVVAKNDIVIVDFWAPWCRHASRLVSRRPACGSDAVGSARNSARRS